MSDMWAYCNSCQRWFFAGSDPGLTAGDADCPVCLHPAVCIADHAQPPARVAS